MIEENDNTVLKAAFFDNAEVHFMLFDKDLNIIDVNKSLLNYFRLTREQLVGKPLIDIAPDAIDKGLYAKYMEVIRTGNPVVIDNNVSHPQYGNQYSRIKAFKVGDGVGATSSNITELKNTIEVLDMFSRRLTHDVRSPIGNILGITELALSESLDHESSKYYCNLIKENAQHLQVILEQVGKTLKIQSGEYTYDLIDFRKIIDDVKKSLSFTPGFDSIYFEETIAVTKEFWFDTSIIISLFQNLIDNAVKYRNAGATKPQILIKVTEEDTNVKIVIADNGIGIKKDLQKSIFGMFFRATTKSQGIGLGLFGVRYGVEKLGGLITFQSVENVGTTFTIFLPFKDNPVISDV